MPSQQTEYLVLEVDAEGNLAPIGAVEARDHKTAIDAALAEREPADRRGRFAACPMRNFRTFSFDTEVEYRTAAEEAELSFPVIEPRKAPASA